MNELLLLSTTASEYEALTPARALLTRLGITHQDRTLPRPPSLPLIQNFLQELSQYPVALWACGESAHLLSLLSLNAPQTLFIVMPVPSTALPEPVLNALFQEAARQAPIAFTPPHAAESAALLAVHWLSARHSSYQDILHAYRTQKLRPQNA